MRASASVSQPPMKPVCPVTKTLRPAQKASLSSSQTTNPNSALFRELSRLAAAGVQHFKTSKLS